MCTTSIAQDPRALRYTIGRLLAAEVQSGDLIVLDGRAPPRVSDSGSVVVESGHLARVYHAPFGQQFHPKIVIGNEARARTATTDRLRRYAASLRLGRSNA